jgi:hypothetical protein
VVGSSEGFGVAKRGSGRDRRVFGYVGDLGVGTEVVLPRVVTWASEEAMLEFLDQGRTKTDRELYSHRVVLAHSGTVNGGMSLPVNGDKPGSWLVKLGDNCAAPTLRVDDRVTVLESVWCGGEGASLWRLYAREVCHWGITEGAPRTEVWL